MPLLLMFGVIAVVISAAVFIAPVAIVVMCVRAAHAKRRVDDASGGVRTTSVEPVALAVD